MTERPMAFTRAGFAGRYQDFANAKPYGAKPYGAKPYGAKPYGAKPYDAKPYDTVSRRAALDRLDVLANVLDTAFILPGTGVRFGVESLLRLVPGVGDVAASTLSAYLLYEASRLGVPRLLMIRMAANVLLEGTLGAVPLAGDAFDVFFRANRRNVALLRRHFAREGLL